MTYTNKTQPTTQSPEDFLNQPFVSDTIKKEALKLISVYSTVVGTPCVMWNKIFGFGRYYYQDSRGGEHEYLLTGFAISKAGFTLYNMVGWVGYEQQLKKLGKYKLSGKSCLSIKSVEEIDSNILSSIVKDSISKMNKNYKVVIE